MTWPFKSMTWHLRLILRFEELDKSSETRVGVVSFAEAELD